MRVPAENVREGLRIALLADAPKLLPQVAAWLHHEWWSRNPANSLQTVIDRLTLCLNRDRLDLTLVCLDGKTPVGTASVVRSDLETRTDLTPWLAALYVNPDSRRRGAGAMLASAAVDHAARLGFPRLFLYTMHATEFYRRNGWEIAGSEKLDADQEAVILQKETGTLADGSATIR